MAAGEQEQKASQESVQPTSEVPTNPYQAGQIDTLPNSPNALAQQSLGRDDPFPSGHVLGQYRILERLGAGGMGQVYKARHLVMDRVVALKIISPHLMRDPSACARFQREVRSVARLVHPNIVVAYDAAEVNGLWFLVMEHIDGQDVSRMLSLHGRPPVALACEIARQAARGLQYAHECGMVHRDIKPANLMVTTAQALPAGNERSRWPETPLVKILDFGLARLSAPDGAGLSPADGLTREGYMVGTPDYMAPEQARDSRSVDIRSDIYALGCVLYTLLAGRPPFKALSTFELAVLHLTQPPDPIVRYNAALPPELDALVQRMLAKEPKDRLQTPGEVAVALQRWVRLVPAANQQLPTVLTPHLQPDVPQKTAAPPMVPSARLAPTASRRPAFEEPTIPAPVFWMHFQALLRTIFFVVLVAAIGIGCLLYLPDIGNSILQLWNRLTPQTTRSAPSR